MPFPCELIMAMTAGPMAMTAGQMRMTPEQITAFLSPNSPSSPAAHPSCPGPHALQRQPQDWLPLPQFHQPQHVIRERWAPPAYCRLQTQLSASCDYFWDLNQPRLPLPQVRRPKLSQEKHPMEKPGKTNRMCLAKSRAPRAALLRV